MIRHTLIPAAFALAATLAPTATSAQTTTAGTLEITAPWARETAQGQTAGGGFLTIGNKGKAPDRLLGGSTPVAAEVQIHTMSMDGGVMRMRPLRDGLAIPPGGSVALKPGSFHIMFMRLKRPLKRGEAFPVTLRFARAGDVAVRFRVEAVTHGTAGKDAHGGNSHDSH